MGNKRGAGAVRFFGWRLGSRPRRLGRWGGLAGGCRIGGPYIGGGSGNGVGDVASPGGHRPTVKIAVGIRTLAK